MAVKEVTDQTFESEVLQNPGVTLIDFWAPWCGPCRMLSPIVEELAQTYGDRATIAKMNVDDNPETPGRYGIQGIPTLMLFKDGELVDTMVGLQPKEVLAERLEAAL